MIVVVTLETPPLYETHLILTGKRPVEHQALGMYPDQVDHPHQSRGVIMKVGLVLRCEQKWYLLDTGTPATTSIEI